MACDTMALSGSSTVSYISWMQSTTQAPVSLPSYHHNVPPIQTLHSNSQRSTGYHHLGRTVSSAYLHLPTYLPTAYVSTSTYVRTYRTYMPGRRDNQSSLPTYSYRTWRIPSIALIRARSFGPAVRRPPMNTISTYRKVKFLIRHADAVFWSNRFLKS